MQLAVIILIIALCFIYILWYQLKTLKQNHQTAAGFFNNYLEHDIVYKYELVPAKGFSYLSGAVTKILGYTTEEYDGNPQLLFDVVHPEDKQQLENKLTSQANFTEPLLFRCIDKNGQEVWLEEYVTPVYDANGRLIALEGICRDITKRKLIEESLEYKFLHDPLTEVYSRAYFEQMLKCMGQGQQSVAIMVCDLDGLKQVNDNLGHPAGDKLLKVAAEVLMNTFAGQGTIARIGGDEFAVLFSGTNRKNLKKLFWKLHENIQDYNKQSPQLRLSISVGYALSQEVNKNMEELFKEADIRMYKKKDVRKGSNMQ